MNQRRKGNKIKPQMPNESEGWATTRAAWAKSSERQGWATLAWAESVMG